MDHTNDLSSKTFKRVDTNLHGKLKNYFLTHYSHYLVPGFNLSRTPWIDTWDIDNVMKLHQEFPYNCDLPKPLLPPVKITKNVFSDGDPAVQLISTKTQINDDVQRILDHYQKHKKAFVAAPFKKELTWEQKSRVNRTTLPRYVADLAATVEMDPDPHFTGKYNWYYTGGSLMSVQFAGENLIVFPYMGDLVVTPVTSMENSICKPILRLAATCKTDEVIYETRITTQNDVCRVLGRFKNDCIFYSLTENHDKLHMLQVHKQESKLPYISADLDPLNYNKFCTMNVDRTLILWDMVSCKSIIAATVDVSKVLEDKWGTVRFMRTDPNMIVFADRCCFHYLDTRDPFERPVLSLCPRSNLEACESICMALPSCTEDHNYVASYHSLFLLDRRSPQACVQQKWTHQFKSAPLLGAVRTRDETEVIVLSSQLSGETTIILNTWNDRDNPHSYNLPYTPPSVLETLNECQMQGKCLDPSLRKRLELSTVGTSMAVDNSGDLMLFHQNSIGDIFYQCITHEDVLDKYSPVNCQAYYAMEAWENRILSTEHAITPLVMNGRTNMHHVFDNFTNKNLRLERDVCPPELYRDPEWKQSLEKLKTYVDILAPELLSVWEVTESSVPATQPTVPHEKVLNWLEMAGSKDLSQTEDVPEFISTPVNTQELFSVSQQPELIDIAREEPSDAYYPPVKVKTHRKPSTKKRTYVAGF